MNNGVFHPPSHYLRRLKGFKWIGIGGQVTLGILDHFRHLTLAITLDKLFFPY
jgi:hypothetical protein